MVIVAKKTMPANDLKELNVRLKANPDKAAQGTSGAGAATHVAGVFFEKETGARIQLVPYRGAGPAMQDLMAGQIDLMIDAAAIPFRRFVPALSKPMPSRPRVAWLPRPKS